MRDAILSSDATSISDDDGLGVISYQWQRDNVDIVGATNQTYTLVQEDVEKEVRLSIKYTDQFGNDEIVYSSATDPIENVNDTPVITTTSALQTDENVAIENIILSAQDLDGDNLTVSFSNPSKGSITDNNNGTYSYFPDTNKNGSDSFSITVSDGIVDVSQLVTVGINDVTKLPVLHYDISGETPQFIGLDYLIVTSSGDPNFSYSYKNKSDTSDIDVEFTGDLQNISFKFLNTEIPLFDTSGGLPPLDVGIQRSGDTDLLYVHAHPTNSTLSSPSAENYIGSFMLLLDKDIPNISTHAEFMEFASTFGSDIVQIPETVAHGPDNADWLFNSHDIEVSTLTRGGAGLIRRRCYNRFCWWRAFNYTELFERS